MTRNRIEERGSRIKDQGLHPQGVGHAVPAAKAMTATLPSEVRYSACNATVMTRSSFPAPRSPINGFSLVSAIFLLVVIAALGTFAVTLSTTQQQSAALDVIGARAYQAARAGIEWGAYQALPASGAAFATSCRSGATSQVVSPLPNTLAGFTVNVECSATAHSEAAATVTVYRLTSKAAQGAVATPDYVERQITTTVAQ